MSEELGGFVILGAAECGTDMANADMANADMANADMANAGFGRGFYALYVACLVSRTALYPTTNKAEPILSHIPSIERDGSCLGLCRI